MWQVRHVASALMWRLRHVASASHGKCVTWRVRQRSECKAFSAIYGSSEITQRSRPTKILAHTSGKECMVNSYECSCDI
eukprot:1143878-Pelagomonas_calceolata.AAC.1